MIYARQAALVPRAALVFAVAGVAAGGGRDAAAVAPPDQAARCRRIDDALAHARDGRRLDASVQGAWQIVHGILAFGPDFPLDARGTTTPALDYLLGGGRATGWRLRAGSVGVTAEVDAGSTMGQGHPDQWLGYLSQCGVAADGHGTPAGIPLDTPLEVGGRSFTVRDLLAQAQHDIRPGQEATWTLMALAHWLPPDAAWTAGDGEAWTTERVVGMEARADVPSAACGGAHRLYGLATAVAAYRRATGRDPEGGWAEAESVAMMPKLMSWAAAARQFRARAVQVSRWRKFIKVSPCGWVQGLTARPCKSLGLCAKGSGAVISCSACVP